MYVSVQFISVLPYRELLIVVYGNVDLPIAHRLVFRVMELRHIRMFQSLLRSQPLLGIEVQQILHQV